jgi:hypothetical protein
MYAPSFPFRAGVLLRALIFLAAPLAAETPFSWNFLWAGSWEEGGRLAGRGDLKFHFPGPNLTLRGEILDRRQGGWDALPPFGGSWKEGEPRFLGALYHQGTGSRILYGALEEWGLSARLRSPWSRGLPFAESRKASTADLRSAYSGKEDTLYLYLGSPYLGLPGGGFPRLRAFGSMRLDPAKLSAGTSSFAPLGDGTALGAGLEGRFAPGVSLSLEGFAGAGGIPEKNPTAWFLESPPLPDQEFRILGFGLLFNSPYVSLSADAAWPQISIYGGDFPQNLYANLGIRVGTKGAGRRPSSWQLSLAADGAGPYYTGSDGAGAGAGFRLGGKFEVQSRRAGSFRINTGLSGPGFTPDPAGGLSFDRSSSGFSYRPPAGTLPLRISRLSLSASRDARETEHIKDSAVLGLSLAGSPRDLGRTITQGRFGSLLPLESAFSPGTLGLSLSGTLAGSPKPGTRPEGEGEALPWPVPGGPYLFESLKTGLELSWSRPLELPDGPLARLINGSPGKNSEKSPPGRGNLQVKAGFDYGLTEDGEGGLTDRRDLSFSATLRGKIGRFALKLGYPDLPPEPFDTPVSLRDAWELSLTWRREWR